MWAPSCVCIFSIFSNHRRDSLQPIHQPIHQHAMKPTPTDESAVWPRPELTQPIAWSFPPRGASERASERRVPVEVKDSAKDLPHGHGRVLLAVSVETRGAVLRWSSWDSGTCSNCELLREELFAGRSCQVRSKHKSFIFMRMQFDKNEGNIRETAEFFQSMFQEGNILLPPCSSGQCVLFPAKSTLASGIL